MAKTGKLICGTIFCFSGVIFLAIVGALLKYQPVYVHSAKKPESTANSCFKAAGVYAFFTVAFFALYQRDKRRMVLDTTPQERAYYELADSDEALPLALHMSPMERTYSLTHSRSPAPRMSKTA